MIGHVVWDWNGTLLDDLDLVVMAASAACATLGRHPVTAEEYRASFTRPIETSYERLLGRTLVAGEWQALSMKFHGSYQASLSRARLATDATDAIEVVARAGLSQSVLSMWIHRELVPLVESFDLMEWFLRVDGQPTFGGGKKEEHLHRHLDALGFRGDQVLVIGDTVDDAHAAAAVGAACVLVDSGPHFREALAETGFPVTTSLLAALTVAGFSVAAGDME